MPPCDFVPKAYAGPQFDTLKKIRGQYISPSLYTIYKDPVLLHQGHMQYLYDQNGRRYLDMIGGICTVSIGHCHPKVTKKVNEQINTMWHTSNIYYHPSIHEYSEKLASKLPGNLKVVYLVNSGTEANDLALMLARLYTGNYNVISLRNSYHGLSSTMMGVSASGLYKHNIPSGFGVHHAMLPDPYQGPWGGSKCRDSISQINRTCNCSTECEAGLNYYEQIEEAIHTSPTRFTVVMGDFNAKLGIGNCEELKMGKFGVGQRNRRGQRLADFMEKEELSMMNSFFKKRPHRTWTWMRSDSLTKNEIDFILTPDRRIFNDVSVINRVKTGSDHRMIFKHSIPDGKVAAMFAEPIQGVGGIVQYPKNYLKKARDLLNKNGGLFIADEVQTGFGRLGDHFWGFESHDIMPDIVTMAKGIGNGFPLGAVVTTPEIAAAHSKALYFNTFGGNAISGTVGLAVLEAIKEDKLQENSKVVGSYILNKLKQLQQRFGEIGDVRGKGLMIGIELVEPGTKNPLQKPHLLNIMELTKDMGVLLGRGGIGNVLRIQPPMCITKEDADFVVQVLEQALLHYLQPEKINIK